MSAPTGLTVEQMEEYILRLRGFLTASRELSVRLRERNKELEDYAGILRAELEAMRDERKRMIESMMFCSGLCGAEWRKEMMALDGEGGE